MRVGKKVVRICTKAKSPRQSQGGGGYAPANRAGDGGYVGAERPSAMRLGGKSAVRRAAISTRRGAPPWQASVAVCLGCPWDQTGQVATFGLSIENLTNLASGPVDYA